MVKKNKFNEQCITYSQMSMIFNARIFWRRFTTWIRVYIISRYAGIGTEEEAFGRLYIETSGVGDMLQIIFERENAARVSQLLNLIIFTLRDLITSQLAGNTEGMRQNVNRLYKNIEDLSAYLSLINPYLNREEWVNTAKAYAENTLEEANSFVTGNYGKDIEAFGRLTELSNKMGYLFAEALYDYVTSGSQNGDSLPSDGGQQCITREQMNQIFDIRMFWFELTTWVRSYMISRYRGIGNANEIKARLDQVVAEYTDALRTIFGDKVDPYLKMLNDYIDLIDDLITAQKDNNTDGLNRITQLLYRNADQRAEFLASINPYWDQSEWRRRLYNHLRSTIAESTTFLTGDYARNLDIFSTLLEQAESASGYFARGIFRYISSTQKTGRYYYG